MTVNRDKNGRFVHGNEGGGRHKIPPDVKEAIRSACPKAVAVLVSLLDSKKEAYRLEAAKTLLDRGYGKPEVMSKVELSGENHGAIMFKWMTGENGAT